MLMADAEGGAGPEIFTLLGAMSGSGGEHLYFRQRDRPPIEVEDPDNTAHRTERAIMLGGPPLLSCRPIRQMLSRSEN